MRVYPDTSALLKLYVLEEESERIIMLFQREQMRVLYHDLHDLELRNAVLLGVFQKRLQLAQAERALAALDQDLASGWYEFFEPTFAQVRHRAVRLALASTSTIGTRSLGLMHVALAQISQADAMLTFDERQAQCARQAGIACL